MFPYKVDHIGIAVKNMSISSELYRNLLGVLPYKLEEVENEHVQVCFFRVGDTKIELLQAMSPESAIAKFIEQRGEGMHHIAYGVEDIKMAMQEAVKNGFRLLNEEPKRGADNKWVCFLHPKTCGGTLVEFCQSIKEI